MATWAGMGKVTRSKTCSLRPWLLVLLSVMLRIIVVVFQIRRYGVTQLDDNLGERNMVGRVRRPTTTTGDETSLEMEPLFDEIPTEEIDSNNSTSPSRTNSKKCCKGCRVPNLGLIMAVGSCLMFSLCSLIVKILSDIPFAELAVFRFAGVFLPTLPVIIKEGKEPFPKGSRLMLILRSILGTTALLLQFYAFQHMPLADASVIVFSSPVFVAVFARLFLKEPCGVFQACLIALTLLGVVLTTRPPWLFGTLKDSYTADEWKGAIAAFCGTIVASNVFITLRVLKDVHFSVSLLNFSIIAMVITSLVTYFFTAPCVPPCGSVRWMILGIGVLSFAGQILKTKALQVEEAGPVSIARTSDVVFSFIWQVIFFGEVPDVLTISGALLVMSCVVLIGIRKWASSITENSRLHRFLSRLF